MAWLDIFLIVMSNLLKVIKVNFAGVADIRYKNRLSRKSFPYHLIQRLTNVLTSEDPGLSIENHRSRQPFVTNHFYF